MAGTKVPELLQNAVSSPDLSPDVSPVPAKVSPFPSPEPDWLQATVTAARMACAHYCVRNDLGSDELRELLDMLGLLDGGVATLTAQTLVPVCTNEFKTR